MAPIMIGVAAVIVVGLACWYWDRSDRASYVSKVWMRENRYDRTGY